MMWLAVGIGGALGSMARHGVNVAVTRVAGQAVPYATAVVNLVGCLVIGLLAGSVATQALRFSTTTRAFVFVGILGGFTTFSSFGLDTFVLVQEGQHSRAVWNVLIQVGGGLAAVFAGYAIAQSLSRGA
jgi:fluoride exporter